MRSLSILLSLWAVAISGVYSTALTYKLGASEKACFFAFVQRQDAKVAFYFAVRLHDSRAAVDLLILIYVQVQSGGSFDVDYTVVGPNEKKILAGEKERQGDFVFTAQTAGEYRFCFNNEMSTFADKMVDFEIAVRSSRRAIHNVTVSDNTTHLQVEDESKSALLPQKQGSSPEQHSALEDMIFKVSGQLSTISRMQKYFRTRENRNFSTVRSTEQRIFNFSLIEVCMMVGMAALQVLVVRFFFQGARKGECSVVLRKYVEGCGLTAVGQDMYRMHCIIDAAWMGVAGDRQHVV